MFTVVAPAAASGAALAVDRDELDAEPADELLLEPQPATVSAAASAATAVDVEDRLMFGPYGR
jgi:hypothetical protein